MLEFDNLDIVVVTNNGRQPTITQYLSGIKHIVYNNPNHNFPNNIKLNMDLTRLAWSPISAYRCYMGHIGAIKRSTKPYVLVFEDDAKPNRGDWLDIVISSIELMKSAEVISFHGREWSGDLASLYIKHDNLKFVKPAPMANDKYNRTWCLSAQSYLINDTTRNRLINWDYDGLPMDFILPSRFNFYVMEKTCFDHDKTKKSLMVRDDAIDLPLLPNS